ncbi:WD40 repeat-like protein [Ramicandelaber brevisporus]|nr:WD40 repeat-like protein [Ramicandelaber brevisporus]
MYLAFNQDCSCLAVGSSGGFSIHGVDPPGRYFVHSGEPIGCVELLFSTSLVAISASFSNGKRELRLMNTKRNSIICKLDFPTSILALRMNRRRLAVVLEEQLYIYDIAKMELKTMIDTAFNPLGVCAMSSVGDQLYIAFPGSTSSLDNADGSMKQSPINAAALSAAGCGNGTVVIFDAIACAPVTIIPAHKAPITALAISPDGTLLATASEKGTVVRVFDVPSGERRYTFRRGSYPVRIQSMCFSRDDSLLAVSSDSGTVHIFKMGSSSPSTSPTRLNAASDAGLDGHWDSADAAKQNNPSSSTKSASGAVTSWAGKVGGKLASKAAAYLPGGIADILEPDRDFASLRIPPLSPASPTSGKGKPTNVYVATDDGRLLVYGIDLVKGGTCPLLRQHSLTSA